MENNGISSKWEKLIDLNSNSVIKIQVKYEYPLLTYNILRQFGRCILANKQELHMDIFS